MTQAKQVLQQCHQQQVIARASWKNSRCVRMRDSALNWLCRVEERAQTKEADAAREEAHKSCVDFAWRSFSNQV